MTAEDPNPPLPTWGERGWYGEQHADGVDLSLIRARLAMSPVERLRAMEQHADEVLRLMRYGRQHRADAAGADRRDLPAPKPRS